MNIMSIYYHADSIIPTNNYKKAQAEQQIFSAAPPEFLVFCFELFNENFQVRLLSPSSLPPAVYVITSHGEEYAQEQIQERSELPGCKVCAEERDEPGLQQASCD